MSRIVVEPGAVPPKNLWVSFTYDQVGCARCGADEHLHLQGLPFTDPIDFGDGFVATHWAKCPMNGEPILYCQGPGLAVAS